MKAIEPEFSNPQNPHKSQAQLSVLVTSALGDRQADPRSSVASWPGQNIELWVQPERSSEANVDHKSSRINTTFASDAE